MGRPRKYPVPATAPVREPDEEPEAEELESAPEYLEPGELVARALENPRVKLTPETLNALNQEWYDLCKADDDYARQRCRRIIERLRRASHEELHPGCTRITLTVPVLKRADGRGGIWYVTINERKYVGDVEVWECEARTILELIHRYRQVEANRMSENQEHFVDLDMGTVAERARMIQRA